MRFARHSLAILITSSVCSYGVLAQPLPDEGGPGDTFLIRGDVDGDRNLTLGDAVAILHQLFLGLSIRCADASDVDDNGTLEVADAIHVLSYLFLGGPRPPPPYPGCGRDPTEDLLSCGEFPSCKPFHALKNSLGMTLVFLPPGEFIMGSPGTERNRIRDDNGSPNDTYDETQHRVTLTCGFYMAATEVTQPVYKLLMGENPSFFQGTQATHARMPVNNVTWFKAVEFCKKLTLYERVHESGREYRLPSEAEWEYACRAETTTRFWFGEALDCRDDLEYFINCPELAPFSIYANDSVEVREVAIGKANPWGLFDMPGNVSEWCLDWLGKYPKEAVTDPAGPKTSWGRVLRGHSMFAVSRGRSAARAATGPDAVGANIGFRVVLAACRPLPVTQR